MAEKINIASLQIDFNQVIKKSGEYRQQIEALKKTQKSLDKTTEEGAKAYAANEVQLKQLNKAYRDNQAFATALENANKDLEKTMSSTGKSTQELRDSRRDLNQISKQLERSEGELTGNLEEERALREQLNTVIDQQTEALREQSSEFNASKDKIGEYEQGIKAAFDEINILNGGIGGFIKRSAEAGGTGKLFTDSLKGMTKGMFGLIKASVAFIATPLGALIAVLAGAFALVRNAMNRSEDATNKIRKAFSGFSGIVKGLLKFLEPLGEFLIDGLVKGFELVEKGVFKAMQGISAALDFLGFDETAASLRGFTEEIQANAEASRKLVEAEIALEKSQRIAQKTQLDYQKIAERFRQIRDDENRTIAERIQANEDLGKVLQKQLQAELKIANQALEVAKLRIQAEGETKEALDEQAEALTNIADIQERITGQESEQLTNRVALQKEAADKAKEAREEARRIADEAIAQQNAELELFIQQQGVRAKTLREGLELEREISRQKIEILRAELANRNKTQTEFDAAYLAIQNDLARKQAELAVDNARRELQAYIEKNQSKIDNEIFFSEELFNQEKQRFEALAEQRREFEALRLEEGVINQQEFNDAINAINEENRLALEEIEAERKEAEAEKKAIDLENRLALEEETFQNDLAIRQQRLDIEREQELANAEKTGADKNLINKRYNQLEKNLGKEVVEFKAQQNAQILAGLKGLFGESSVLGKAFAIAEVLSNSVQNASKAFTQAAVFASNPVTAPLAANANIQGGIILATGAAQAARIGGIKLEKGAILKGNSHAQGGIDIGNGYEAEGGEAVINKRSTSMFAPLLSLINVIGGGRRLVKGGTAKVLEGGGMIGSTKIPSSVIDYDLLASKVSEANESLPSPIVGVEEFNSVSQGLADVEETAEF